MNLIIIGRGPAGLTAAIYAARAGINVTVIGNTDGATATATSVENYFGFENPVKGKDLMMAGLAQAKRLGVTIVDAEVTSASWGEKGYLIKTATCNYNTQALVIATGASRKRPSIPNLASYEGKGVSYCAVCDAFFMKGKTVAVVGNGEYALGEAHELKPFASEVKIFTNGKASNQALEDSGFELITNSISALGGDSTLSHIKTSDGKEYAISGLFVAEGIAGAKSFATKLGLEANDKGLIFKENQETNLPGIFVCGDCTGSLPQIAVAVGQGAIAGLAAANYLKAQAGEKPVAVQWSKH